ncbi:hypothetical protein ACFQ9X_19830 [Catenulispora yoronensis]
MLVDIGNLDLARAWADSSVRHLSRYADRPRRIQSSLLVALAVLQRAASASGHTEQAVSAGLRAASLYAVLVAGDPSYAQDLAGAI